MVFEKSLRSCENVCFIQTKFTINFDTTGTPIEKNVQDLQALFQFIEMAPWTSARWFNEYLAGPFRANIPEPLRDVLGECMWRLSKQDVEAEMDLPQCTTVTNVVRFNGIEKQLYQQVYRDCVKKITGRLNTMPKVQGLTPNAGQRVLTPNSGHE